MTITVTRTPAYLTVQDTGRQGARSIGVPSGGAMDQTALQLANILAGNPKDASSLEWALGGGTLRFDSDHVVALAGATAHATLGGKPVRNHRVSFARSGDELEVGGIGPGRFLYVAIGGGIEVPNLIGSRSTYLPGRFGGFEGRSLRTGDVLQIGERAAGRQNGLSAGARLAAGYSRTTIRIVRGAHAELFDDRAWETLLGTVYRVSAASDRTGYRLEGPPVSGSALSLPSEAGCPGVIQIPGDGMPIVLMADAPTIGGYPKIAVVCGADLPIIAQKAPGEAVRFALVTIEESQRALRSSIASLEEFETTTEKTSAANS